MKQLPQEAGCAMLILAVAVGIAIVVTALHFAGVNVNQLLPR